LPQALRSAYARLFSFSAMLVSLLVLLIFFLCVGQPIFADPDLWWHMRDAAYLITTHSFLHADMYSFTAGGRPWINSEWLSELPFYFAWRWFGPRGLLLLTITLIEAVTLGVCWLGWQRTRNIKPALLACCLFLPMISVSMGPRTVMFGWLCLVVELFLLQEFREGRDRLWLLPLLFAVWINAHGTWPIGMIYLLLFVACGMFEGSWGSIVAEPWSPPQRTKLIWITGLAVLGLFLNPYGPRLVAFPFHMLFGHKLMIDSVQEWQSLNFHTVRGKLIFATIAVLVILNTVRKRTWRLNELLFALIAILAAFTYTRLLVLAGIVLCPLLAVEFDFFEPYNQAEDKPIFNLAIIAILMTILVTQVPGQSKLQQQIVESCPEKAVAYLRTAQLDGRILNDLSWGGYIEWNDPGLPVFIDSRSELFDPWGVLQEYIDATSIKRPLEVIDKYQIRYVLFPKEEPIVYLLTRTPGWSIKYQDKSTILLERNQPR
jgi:hypothetical protein